jgi:uncharacterized protein (DUF1778 family)
LNRQETTVGTQEPKAERTDVRATTAAEPLADRPNFALDDECWAAFQAALDRPVRYKPRLAKLLAERSVIE